MSLCKCPIAQMLLLKCLRSNVPSLKTKVHGSNVLMLKCPITQMSTLKHPIAQMSFAQCPICHSNICCSYVLCSNVPLLDCPVARMSCSSNVLLFICPSLKYPVENVKTSPGHLGDGPKHLIRNGFLCSHSHRNSNFMRSSNV